MIWACPFPSLKILRTGRAFRSYSSLVPRCGVNASITHAEESQQL